MCPVFILMSVKESITSKTIGVTYLPETYKVLIVVTFIEAARSILYVFTGRGAQVNLPKIHEAGV